MPLVVSEVNPEAALSAIAERGNGMIIANPNCTTMAAMPVLKPLHDAAGLRRLVVDHLPGGVRVGLDGVAELDGQVRAVVEGGAAGALTHDGSAVEFPEPKKYVRPIAFNVIAAGRQLRRRRLRRDRRGTEAAQRVPQDPVDPGAAGVRNLCPGAGFHRALAVDQRRVQPAAVGGQATELLSGAPGVELTDVPNPLQAAGSDPSYVGRIRQDRRCRTVAGWCCSSPTTTCARVPR